MRPNAFAKSLCLLCFFAVLVMGTRTGKAQEARREFWPEIDVYINIKPKLRLYLLGTISKSVEDGELFNAQSYEAQIGAHVDYIPNKHLILRTGYRYGTAVGDADDGFREHRLIAEQTLRKMLPGDFLLSDRNREDFRFLNGEFSFRYRNRVTIERELPIFKGRNITPYVSGEIFYDTRFDVWNRNRFAVGVQHTLLRGPLQKMLLHKRQVVLDVYFMKQNDSRSQTPHVKAFGAALVFYF
ncbi:MAG TPA: DUF2490 domain-containing protein [Pyrinomonadaceae bacterium]|nr:DUF2490 domain-containing protein [Pyrinomonadaceae bacterium]